MPEIATTTTAAAAAAADRGFGNPGIDVLAAMGRSAWISSSSSSSSSSDYGGGGSSGNSGDDGSGSSSEGSEGDGSDSSSSSTSDGDDAGNYPIRQVMVMVAPTGNFPLLHEGNDGECDNDDKIMPV